MNCQHNDFVFENGYKICIDCGESIRELLIEEQYYHAFSDSCNLRNKIYYDRVDNFKRIIDSYCCIDFVQIKEETWDLLKNAYTNKEINTKEELHYLIRKTNKKNKNLKLHRLYTHITLIWFWLSGYRPYSLIEHRDVIEYQFKLLITQFENIRFDIGKKNFISYQLVLYELLKLNKIPHNVSDFRFIKTKKNFIAHVEIFNRLLLITNLNIEN